MRQRSNLCLVREVMTTAVELLRAEFLDSCQRLTSRLEGITDEEFFWEPCSGCWTLRRISESQINARGEWQIDYADYGTGPPPVTTVAWRLIHIASGNWIYWEYAFGAGLRTFLDLEVPGTAAGAVEWLRASQEPLIQVLGELSDEDLDRPRPTNWGEVWPTHKLLSTLVVEQVHHGAEIGLLRDLFRNRASLGD
jgi:DinB superfamily